MSSPNVEAVLSHPKFQKLVKRRNGYATWMSIAILVIYFGFILLVAFAKPVLAQKIGTGVTTVGIVVGLVVIVSSFVLVGLYVRRANGEFDQLTNDLVKEIAG